MLGTLALCPPHKTDAGTGARMTENFRDNEDRNRFELDVEGAIAFVAYRKSPGAITLVHTEVPPQLGGKGIGSKLGRATLDAVRAQGRKLTVECDFIRSFMIKHGEYNDLLADGAKTVS
jgi:predicted GNAT family acetyltransferase